ncbi:MAG: ECF-type riboflavin transporter substrate-binding protein [Lachnospiraceae bacterium]|nr:ECF-type riboflavin transporter substrate-binding protein [Lachnospiraceae bacterium]
MEKKNNLSIKTIVAIGIGAALFFVLGRFVAIPSPVPNTTINIQYGVLSVFAVIYGPIVGVLAGFIGHTLIDLSWGSPWWSWIIATAVFGLVVGFAKKMIKVNDGKFGAKEIIMFNVFQIVGHILAWVAVAPTLDIVIYSEPLEKIYLQGAFAGISNAVSTAIVGTILLIAYAKTRTKTGSLKKED